MTTRRTEDQALPKVATPSRGEATGAEDSQGDRGNLRRSEVGVFEREVRVVVKDESQPAPVKPSVVLLAQETSTQPGVSEENEDASVVSEDTSASNGGSLFPPLPPFLETAGMRAACRRTWAHGEDCPRTIILKQEGDEDQSPPRRLQSSPPTPVVSSAPAAPSTLLQATISDPENRQSSSPFPVVADTTTTTAADSAGPVLVTASLPRITVLLTSSLQTKCNAVKKSERILLAPKNALGKMGVDLPAGCGLKASPSFFRGGHSTSTARQPYSGASKKPKRDLAFGCSPMHMGGDNPLGSWSSSPVLREYSQGSPTKTWPSTTWNRTQAGTAGREERRKVLIRVLNEALAMAADLLEREDPDIEM